MSDARAALAIACGLAGCLGPQVGDDPGPSGYVVPADTPVPTVEDDQPDLAARIAEHDGVDGFVPLETAFADDAVVRVWDLGPAPAVAAPLFVLIRRSGDEVIPLPHPGIVGAVPGDPGYSPFRIVFHLEVTDRYDGELITAVAGLAEAQRRGLIGAPVARGLAVDCPIVAPDVRVDVGPGAPAVAPAQRFFHDGHTVAYLDFGPVPLQGTIHVRTAVRYRLRREGGEPLHERVRGVDLTGDGDTVDGNDVFVEPPGLATSSPLVATTAVVVVPTIASIDTSRDETIAEVRRAGQLFAPDPVAGVVVGFTAGTELRNLPGQGRPGAL